MAADKFDCPRCGPGYVATVKNTVVSAKGTTRYRACRVCSLSFATVETIKETPKLRQLIGEGKAREIWSDPPFKYRTIKQQKRATKSSA